MPAYSYFASLFLFLLTLEGIQNSFAQPSPCGPDSEEIPIPSDTLLYVDNRGLSRIFVQINENSFKLATDSTEVARSQNAFPIPRTGKITVDVAALVCPEDPNCIAFTTQGPPESSAETILTRRGMVGGAEAAFRRGRHGLGADLAQSAMQERPHLVAGGEP